MTSERAQRAGEPKAGYVDGMADDGSTAAAPPLLIRNARVLTLRGEGARRGAAMGELGVLPRADVLVRDGVIAEVRTGEIGKTGSGGRDARPTEESEVEEIDAGGRVLMPAFIDAHTHACWAG